MHSKKVIYTSALAASLVAAAPAPLPVAEAAAEPFHFPTSFKWNSNYGPAPTGGSAQFSRASSVISSYMSVATVFGPDSQVPYSNVPTPTPYPIRSSQVTGATSHGPYSGIPTTTGAVKNNPKSASVGTLPLNPTATYYNTNGKLQNQQPAPYVPAGGLGTNGSLPRYQVESDFDYESIMLGLYQEWIELDLFHNGLAVFSAQDFLDAGLTAEDRSYIEFMADQESGHATLLTNMLGETAAPQW